MKTNEQFLQEVENLVGEKYCFMESYKGAMKKIKVKHMNDSCDNHTYEVTPNNFLGGRRCPECNRLSKMNDSEWFKQKVKELTNEEYVFLEKYKGSNTPLKVQHNSELCNYNTYLVSPNNFIDAGQRCPECSILEYYEKRRAHYEKEFIDKVEGDTDREFTVLERYTNNRTPIMIQHNSDYCDEYRFTTYPQGFKKRPECPACSGLVKTDFIFKKEMKDLVGGEYVFLGDYKKDNIKIKVRHNSEKCNYHEYHVKPNNFKNGRRCPICRTSKGEMKIYKYLNKKGFNLKREYEVYAEGKRFRYDFALLSDDGLPYYLIEFDGIQHFEPVEFFRGKRGFKATVENDMKKNEIAKEAGIELLRIRYTDYNRIESILERNLSVFSK